MAEDDLSISELLSMNLEAAGYLSVPAYDGEEAELAVRIFAKQSVLENG